MRMISVIFETEAPGKILYRHGNVTRYLNGVHAWLYRQMIGVYGKAEAADRFWQLWHGAGVDENFYRKEEHDRLAAQEEND